MAKSKQALIFTILTLLFTLTVNAQRIVNPDAERERLAAIETALSELAARDPVYASEVDISVARQPLAELLRTVASVSKVNLSVRGAENTVVTCNFSRARIIDLINFLCREYSLDVSVVGNIVSISPLAKPAPAPKEISVMYRIATNSLSLDLSGDRLGEVAKRITDLTGTNFIIPQQLAAQALSGYIRDMPLDDAVRSMAQMNGLKVAREGRVWVFKIPEPPKTMMRGGQQPEFVTDTVAMVGMQFRSVRELSNFIPKHIADGVEIKEFHDLNSVIISGKRDAVARVSTFLSEIDRRVPLVTIEVMIVDATKRRATDIGVEAGFGKSDVKNAGSLTGVDVTLNSAGINRLIGMFNGFGSVNLGQVGPGFYAGLKFLEDNGTIEVRSTPKLSTLNGHEATLTSGERRYYKEMANNYYGSQITVATESYIWKPIDANLEIKITPLVSEDRQITLDITIDQTEFTAQQQAEAPPGTAKRSFKSLIRVGNEEMVLLGGIDQNVREKSNSGLPGISRVPVLRWFFGKNRDNKREQLLNVFIKPTLVE